MRSLTIAKIHFLISDRRFNSAISRYIISCVQNIKKETYPMTTHEPYTLNESYNRPPYILAASSENRNKKSMFSILYKRRILAKVSSNNFT